MENSNAVNIIAECEPNCIEGCSHGGHRVHSILFLSLGHQQTPAANTEFYYSIWSCSGASVWNVPAGCVSVSAYRQHQASLANMGKIFVVADSNEKISLLM